MKIYMFLIAIFCSFGSMLVSEDLSIQLIQQAGTDFSGYYRPVGTWCGRLILPDADERDPEGGVYIQLNCAGDRAYAGKTLRLRWNMERPWNRWGRELVFDVNLTPDTRQAARKNNLVIPERIAGWKKVSPLESLAGAHQEDDLYVLIKNPAVKDGCLYIDCEPVIVSGPYCSLAMFRGEASGELRTVQHYNPASGRFDGSLEIVSILSSWHSDQNSSIPKSTTSNIQNVDINQEGWFLYGNRKNGVFIVNALEPAGLFHLSANRTVSGKEPVRKYFRNQHHVDLFRGMKRVTASCPDAKPYQWKVGDRGIVVHLFGWRETDEEPAGAASPLGLTTGHMSFGLAEVVVDGFTGKPRFDVEYKQVYAHNRDGIVSCSHKWHAYMGDLKRGWMYTLPVSDTVIRIPELDPYDFAGWKIDPYQGFSREVEKMMAVYRVGRGRGVASVRPDVSCVQDSHCALYSALKVFENSIAMTGAVKKWLEAEPEASECRRFCRLKLLTRQIQKHITTLGIAQGNWNQHFNDPLGTKDPNLLGKTLNAILSLGTVFPRSGHDSLIQIATDNGYPMWSLMTFQLGGEIKDLRALPPKSLTIRKTE